MFSFKPVLIELYNCNIVQLFNWVLKRRTQYKQPYNLPVKTKRNNVRLLNHIHININLRGWAFDL